MASKRFHPYFFLLSNPLHSLLWGKGNVDFIGIDSTPSAGDVLDGLAEQCLRLISELGELDREKARSMNDVFVLERDKAELRAEIEDTRDYLNKMRDRITEKVAKEKSLGCRIVKQRGELAQLQADCDNAREELAQLAATRDQARSLIEDLETLFGNSSPAPEGIVMQDVTFKTGDSVTLWASSQRKPNLTPELFVELTEPGSDFMSEFEAYDPQAEAPQCDTVSLPEPVAEIVEKRATQVWVDESDDFFEKLFAIYKSPQVLFGATGPARIDGSRA